MTRRPDIFDWTFLDEVGRWTIGVVLVAAIAGAVITRSWAFPVACLLTAAGDLAMVHAASVHGGKLAEHGEVDRGAIVLFIGGRLAYKVLLLSAALLIPLLVDFWGVVVGALAYDTTLIFIGSFLAVDRVYPVGR